MKRRLERSAERDKREIKNNFSADYAQSERGAHFKSSKIKGAGARLCICPFFALHCPVDAVHRHFPGENVLLPGIGAHH